MEIRSDINSLRETGSFRSITSGSAKDAVINTTDSLVKAEVLGDSFKKPEIRASEPEKTEEATETVQAVESQEANPSATGSNSLSTSGIDAVPGPSTAIISAQLQKLERIGVQFLKKRLIPVPFLKHKKISADEAASVLTSGNKSKISRLRAQAGKAEPMPLTDFNDIGELSSFRGVGVMPSQEKDLSEFLKYAGSIGLEFKTDDAKNVGEYGAFNLLTTGWGIAGQNPKPVELVREGVGIMTLKPGENKSPQDLKKELEETWKAIDHIKTFKEPKKYFKGLSKPYQGMSFLEKYQIFDNMDKYCDRALQNYETVTANTRDKKELAEISDILINQEMITAYREPEFDPPDVELMMKKAVPDDASPREKAEVIRGLRRQITGGSTSNYYRERQAFVRDSFKLVQSSSNNGKEFLRLSKLYLSMIDSMGISSNNSESYYPGSFKNAKKTFGFITDQLKGNQDESEAFVGLLKGSTLEQAKERFQSIQMPVKTEDIATRIKVSHALIKTAGFEDNYRLVLENLEPGQDPMELTDLMKTVRNHYKEDDGNSKKAFMDVVQTISLNGLSIREGYDAINILSSSLDRGMDGLRALSLPVGDSSFQDRRNLLAKLRGNYTADNRSYNYDEITARHDRYALEDYKIISSSLAKGETLQNAADRFQIVFDALGGAEHRDEIYDFYNVITESAKNGGSLLSNELVQKALVGGKNRDEMRKLLKEGLKEAARNAQGNNPQTNGKIVQDNEKVIIGGVKVDKKKYENLLKVLE